MNRVEEIAQNSHVQAALASFRQQLFRSLELVIDIQQIPSPTFGETQRADFVRHKFESLGLSDVSKDEISNVYGRYPAQGLDHLPPVIVSAHTDTVFPAGTDLSVRRDGDLIYGPGIGDNATGVAGLLLLAETLSQFKLQPPADVWFVANVGEEGLGDLKGMRAVVDRFGREAIYVVVEGGLYGQISRQAIGVRRFQIEVEAQGGHSWGSFGNTSAIHELGSLIAAITRLEVPIEPKTTYNVGVIEGGTSINTIAQTARLLLDLRSEDPEALMQLVGQVEQIVEHANRRHEVAAKMSLIGSRPAGQLPRDAPLVTWAEASLRHVGCQHIDYIAGSTDANIPLSQEMTAVCIGLAESSNTHRLDEYLDPTHLPNGLGQLLLLTLAAAGF